MSQCYICGSNLYDHSRNELVACLRFIRLEAESCEHILERGLKPTPVLKTVQAKAIKILTTHTTPPETFDDAVNDVTRLLEKKRK